MAEIGTFLDIIRNGSDGDAVRDAIINCMEQINKDSKWIIKDKVISGKVSQLNSGSPYVAAAGTAWKRVTLEIQDDSGEPVTPSTVQKHDFVVDNNTANGEYTAKELFGDNSEFGTVQVNLDFSDTWEQIADNISISTNDLDSATNTFHAETKGYAAVRSITFTNVDAAAARGGKVIAGGVTVYPITFVDSPSGELIAQKDIPENSTITCDIPDEIKRKHAGETFIGWSGGGRATSEATVQAQWGNPIISKEEIRDNWDTIVANRGGAKYSLGSYRAIEVTNFEIPYSADLSCFPDFYDYVTDIVIPNTGSYTYSMTTEMIKIGQGEDGSTSTWLSTPSTMICRSRTLDRQSGSPTDRTTVTGLPWHIDHYIRLKSEALWVQGEPRQQYDTSEAMKWITEIFCGRIIPRSIADGLVTVTKNFKYRNPETGDPSTHQMAYPIWLPSMKELYVEDDSNSSYAAAMDGFFNSASVDAEYHYEQYIANDPDIAFFRDVMGLNAKQRTQLLTAGVGIQSDVNILNGEFSRDTYIDEFHLGTKTISNLLTPKSVTAIDPSNPTYCMGRRPDEREILGCVVFGFNL